MFSEESTFQGVPLPDLPISSKMLRSTTDNSSISYFISDIKDIVQYIDTLLHQYNVYFGQSTELDEIIKATKYLFNFE